MIKAQTLRACIEQALPHIAADKLNMFISKGQILCNPTGTGFTQHYACQIVFTDFAAQPDPLFACIVQFMQSHEKEQMQNEQLAAQAISFEAEALTHDSYDLMITVQLREDISINSTTGEYHHHLKIEDADELTASLFVFGHKSDQTDYQQIYPNAEAIE